MDWWKTASAFAAACCAIAATAAEPTDDGVGMVPRPYTAAVIVAPANDAAVRSNAGNLTVRGQISPKLESGHHAELLLDGVPQGAPRRIPEFSLENVDRGTHRLEIRIVDSDGQVLFAGAPSIVHLLRHSRLHP